MTLSPVIGDIMEAGRADHHVYNIVPEDAATGFQPCQNTLLFCVRFAFKSTWGSLVTILHLVENYRSSQKLQIQHYVRSVPTFWPSPRRMGTLMWRARCWKLVLLWMRTPGRVLEKSSIALVIKDSVYNGLLKSLAGFVGFFMQDAPGGFLCSLPAVVS